MSEFGIRLTGWNALVVFLVLIAIFALRLMTFNDMTGNDELMRKIEMELTTDYFPSDVSKLKAVYEAGDLQEMEKVAKTITSTELDVESVKASYPFLDFSTRRDVVVRVTYSLSGDSGTRARGTKYYRFEHGALGNIWRYKYDAGAISYYLNFF